MNNRMTKNKTRCSTWDEWYDPSNFETKKLHDHPEPQSGSSRDAWLKSNLPYERWIVETSEGRQWKNCDDALMTLQEKLWRAERVIELLDFIMPEKVKQAKNAVSKFSYCSTMGQEMLDLANGIDEIKK